MNGWISAGLTKVPVDSLRPGMYVAELDRPWLESPFALQGFYVRDSEDAQFVASHCSFVYIDPRRSTQVEPRRCVPRRGHTPGERSHLSQELEHVRTDFESAATAMKRVFAELGRNRHIDVAAMQAAVNPLVENVLHNHEAMSALLRMKRCGEYLYNHSLANAVWAAVLGRQIGLDVPTLKRLALGAALVDIGMSQLDSGITRSARALSARETEQVRDHVNLGCRMLLESKNIHPDVLAIVRHHHERQDGSGYPDQLAGPDIPLLARIAGLVDSYDAMITHRPWAAARSSFAAVQELSGCGKYQSELVEQFLQAIGTFPTGSIVELSNGEIGIVVRQNPSRRLRPRVVVVLDADHNRKADLPVIDLASYSQTTQGRAALWIRRELRAGDFGIHPDEFFL